MLRTSLDAHPEIVCLTEMFNPDYTMGVYPFGEDTPEEEIMRGHIFRDDHGAEVRAVGFCIHRLQARFGNWPRLWSILQEDDELHVISLRRENLLRRFWSYQIRPRKGQEIYKDLANNPPPPMELDPEELRADFRRHSAAIADFEARFSGHPLLAISYEDLCQRYEVTIASVQRFLSVTVRPLSPRTTRRHPLPLSRWVINYEALKAQFASTEWAHFFDD